jgi:small subunit ribosomal protein S1
VDGAGEKFAPGTVIEGPVTSITKFGAFVQLAEGVEGMIHVSEISAEKRINHPQDVLKAGQVVKAQSSRARHRKAHHPPQHEATRADRP